MNTSSAFLERLRQVLTTPTQGILGLVDELLALSCEHHLHLIWHAGQCRVRVGKLSEPPVIDVPLRKSVFRAALARIAVLCNERIPNAVSPYGGQGELLVGADATSAIRVFFVNTPDEQSLALVALRNEGTHAIQEAGLEGEKQETAKTASVRA